MISENTLVSSTRRCTYQGASVVQSEKLGFQALDKLEKALVPLCLLCQLSGKFVIRGPIRGLCCLNLCCLLILEKSYSKSVCNTSLMPVQQMTFFLIISSLPWLSHNRLIGLSQYISYRQGPKMNSFNWKNFYWKKKKCSFLSEFSYCYNSWSLIFP